MRETLQTIRSWPDTNFQNNLAKLDDYTKPGGPCAVTTIKLALDEVDVNGDVLIGAETISVFSVGSTTKKGVPIYAWRDKDRLIKLIHVQQARHITSNPFPKQSRHIMTHNNITSPKITFAEPFCWVQPAEDEVGSARFEALIRYFYLKNSQNHITYAKINFLREHLPGACRDVAEHITRVTGGRAAAERCVRLKLRLQSTQKPVPQPQDPPSAPASASAPQSETMDQAFTTFKAVFMDQMSTAQAANHHANAELITQVSSLERKLADAEMEHSELEKSLAVAKEEAAKWKAQHERLLKAVKGISDSHS